MSKEDKKIDCSDTVYWQIIKNSIMDAICAVNKHPEIMTASPSFSCLSGLFTKDLRQDRDQPVHLRFGVVKMETEIFEALISKIFIDK